MTDIEKLALFNQMQVVADEIKAEQKKIQMYDESAKHFLQLRRDSGTHLQELYEKLDKTTIISLLDGIRPFH